MERGEGAPLALLKEPIENTGPAVWSLMSSLRGWAVQALIKPLAHHHYTHTHTYAHIYIQTHTYIHTHTLHTHTLHTHSHTLTERDTHSQ